MKRFFCILCQRVKRVRTLPLNVEHTGTVPTGSCRWHHYRGEQSHRAFLGRDGIPGPQLQRPARRRA